MSSNAPRRSVKWVEARFDIGRTAERKHIYGKIAGRAKVGLSESDWQFVRWLASVSNVAISDVIREAVTSSRENCEREAFEPGEELPWVRPS